MKTFVLKCLLASFLIINCFSISAQSKAKQSVNHDPVTFIISKSDFDRVLLLENNRQFSGRTNKYLDKATLIVNTKSGDMRFLKLKLNYFKNAFLTVQVNGTASTQVFILSDDKSLFYKGQFEKEGLVMVKCKEDDIINE